MPQAGPTSPGAAQSRALAVDAAGRAYLAGSSYDGGFDLALTVVDSDGTTVLAQAILAGAGDEQASGAALDASGALWVSGYTTSPALSLSSGARGFRSQVCAEANGTVYYCSDGILVRYMLEPAGMGWALHQQWGSYMGDAGGSGLTIRSDGVLVLAGAVSTGSLTSSALLTALRWDAPTAQLMPVYEQTLAGMGSASLHALVAGSNGEVYGAGESQIPYNEATGSGGQWRAWVARLDADGAVLRQVYLGSGGNQNANAIARDAQGNIYLAGNNEDVDAFPALAPLADGYQGGGGESFLIGFVAQLDSALNVRYASRIAGESAYSIAVESTGQAFIPTYRSSASGVLVAVAPDGAGWGPELALGDGLVSASAAAIDANDTLYLAGYGAFARIGAPAPQPPVVQPPVSPPPPAHTVSYYERSTDLVVYRRQGCQARYQGEQGIVVLVYGTPKRQGQEYGTKPVQQKNTAPVPEFLSTTDIQKTVQAFADGYIRWQHCQREFGIDFKKLYVMDVEVPTPNLVIAVATSNAPVGKSEAANPALTPEHGAAWGQMVLDIKTYFALQHYRTSIKVTGAYDAEPVWATKQTLRGSDGMVRTIDWAKGFAAKNLFVAEGKVENQGLQYYNMGSLDGTARDSSWLGQDGQPAINPFDQLYQLSWGIPVAYALPQIYNAAYAKEWYQLRYYAIKRGYSPLRLSGVLTECATSACGAKFDTYQQQSWPLYKLDLLNGVDAGGQILDFAPRQGWQAMWDTLHRTLVQPMTLTTNLRLSDGFSMAPQQNNGVTYKQPQLGPDTRCKPYVIPYQYTTLDEPNNRYAPDQYVDVNTASSQPRPSCLAKGTVFPIDSTFSSKFAFSQGTQATFNTDTPQALPWSTDLAWGK